MLAPRLFPRLVCLLAILLIAAGPRAHGYTFQYVGVRSDIHLHEGRVSFLQADGTPTTLDLQSGEVIARGNAVEQPIVTILQSERRWTGRMIDDEPATDEGRQVIRTQFDVLNGTVTITAPPRYGGTQEPSQMRVLVELTSPDGSWRGSLPYVPLRRGEVVAVAGTTDTIVLGTNFGHVEAIDRVQGTSRWIYVFPTIRETRSYSSRGLPPDFAEAAANYRRDQLGNIPHEGFQLEGGPARSAPRITLDPEPANPFKRLPLYLAIAWAGAILPILLIALNVWLARRRRYPPLMAFVFALGITLAPLFVFLHYARVSWVTGLGLRLSMLVGAGAMIYLAYPLRRQQPQWLVSVCLMISFLLSIGLMLLVI